MATLDGIMKAYYDVVTVKKGEKVSYERDSIFTYCKMHRLVGISREKDGKPNLTMISLKDYHKMSDAYLERMVL